MPPKNVKVVKPKKAEAAPKKDAPKKEAKKAEPVAEKVEKVKRAPKKDPATEMAAKYLNSARVSTILADKTVNRAILADITKVKTPLDAYNKAKKRLESGVTKDKREVEKDGKTAIETYERPITADEKKEFQATVAKYDKEVSSLELDLHAYKEHSMRMGSGISDALAVACDALAIEILERSINYTLERGVKTVTKQLMYQSGLEQMKLFPFIATLASYKAYRAEVDEILAKEHDADVTLSALKEFKKEHKVKAKIELDEEEPEDTEHQEDTTGVSFVYYLKTLCQDVDAVKCGAKGVRVLNTVRTHISVLIEEFVERVGHLVRISCEETKKKTISVSMILSTLKRILVDGHTPVETVTIKDVEVVDPATLEAEKKKAADAKAKGKTHVIDKSKLKMMKAREVTHTIEYPTSGYPELERHIHRVLEINA